MRRIDVAQCARDAAALPLALAAREGEMPASYEIDVERRLVRCRAWGALTDWDLVDHYRQIAADPAFDRTFSQLGDLREVERFDLDASTIRREALEAVFDPSAQRALVAPTDIGFGLSRIYESYAELAPQKVRVFREMSEAERWLGLDTEHGIASDERVTQG